MALIAGLTPCDLDMRLEIAKKLRIGVRLTTDEVDIADGLIKTLRTIRNQRGVDRHTRGLCNHALAAFDVR